VTRRHVQRSAEVFLENLEKVNATRH
jgi:hypothetical protein